MLTTDQRQGDATQARADLDRRLEGHRRQFVAYEHQLKEQEHKRLEARYGPSDAWPRLSETLEGPKHPHVCQSCGMEPERPHDTPSEASGAAAGPGPEGGETSDEMWRLMERAVKPPPGVYGWQEHDSNDKPEPVALMLCTPCSARLIEPHPRLYSRIPPNAPFPGIMELCVACRFRVGVRCTHPDLKANGGPGLHIDADQGMAAHVNFGPGRGGQFLTLYRRPPHACAGRSTESVKDAETTDTAGRSRE